MKTHAPVQKKGGCHEGEPDEPEAGGEGAGDAGGEDAAGGEAAGDDDADSDLDGEGGAEDDELASAMARAAL